MRFSQLKAFHHVALHGGFSRAAGALSLTQPAVSEQVRKLEITHDVLLFHRDHRQIRLTPAGEQLFLLTKRLFAVEQQISEYMSETRAATAGRLRIIADSAGHLTDVLGRFRAAHPKVFVSLRTGNTDDVLAALRSYDAEIGVVGSTAPGNDMDTLDLGTTAIIAFAARGTVAATAAPMTLRELAARPLVFRETGSRTRRILEQAATRQKLHLHPVIEVEGREAMREVVASGAGIGFVSEAEFGHDTRLRPIALRDSDLRMSETLICLSQRRDLRVIRAFMDCARDQT